MSTEGAGACRGQGAPNETTVRRSVLQAAGVTALGGAALVACGGSPATSGAPERGAKATSGAPTSIPVAEVPIGRGAVLPADRVVVTQPVEGTFNAFDATCPHQGCAVSLVTEEGIICPCHGSVFDPASGERRSGPAERGLTPRTVTVSGDELTVS